MIIQTTKTAYMNTFNFQQGGQKFAGDIFAFLTGFSFSSVDTPVLNTIHNTLLQTLPTPSQPAIDDITRSVAGLVVAVASRYLFALIDKKINQFNERKTRKNGNKKESSEESSTEESSETQTSEESSTQK
jgi:hypothetical protein